MTRVGLMTLTGKGDEVMELTILLSESWLQHP